MHILIQCVAVSPRVLSAGSIIYRSAKLGSVKCYETHIPVFKRAYLKMSHRLRIMTVSKFLPPREQLRKARGGRCRVACVQVCQKFAAKQKRNRVTLTEQPDNPRLRHARSFLSSGELLGFLEVIRIRIILPYNVESLMY